MRSGQYSLGCTLYYLLSGGPPFGGDNLWDLYQSHFSMDASPLNLVRPEVPVELAALVAKMMAKEPGRRFQEPKDVAQALLPFFRPAATQPSTSGVEAPQAHSRISATRPTGGDPARDQPAIISPPPLPPAVRSSKTAGEEVAWTRLIEIKEDEPLTIPVKPKSAEPKPAPAEGPFRRRPRAWLAVAIGALFLLFAATWIGGVFKFRTPEGMIVVTNIPEDSEILVDGKKITFTWPGRSKPLEIRAVPGQHRVEVKVDGFETQGEIVTVKTGKSAAMTVSLKPLRSEPQMPSVQDSDEDPNDLNSQAWELATAATATDRDGVKAVELATRACEKNEFKSPNFLDTLAAAHAEAGNFGEAVKWQTRAIEYIRMGMMAGGGIDEFGARLDLYRRKKPYHQGAPLGNGQAKEVPGTVDSAQRVGSPSHGDGGFTTLFVGAHAPNLLYSKGVVTVYEPHAADP